MPDPIVTPPATPAASMGATHPDATARMGESGVGVTQVLNARLAAPVAPVTAAPKVLVVDDSRLVRASITKHLRGAFDYIEAGDGQAGWEAIVLDPSIRVVLSDLTMPKLDGYQLLEKIRSSPLPRIRTMPVVIISGDEEEAAKASALGATEFITKGVSTVELLARIEVLMKLSHKQEQLDHVQETAQAPHDASGLATRAFLDVEADKMWTFTRRHGIDFVVMCVQLDDVHGLAPEAAAIRTSIRERVFGFIAEMLAKAIRREDCVARTGDNEFVVAAMGISPNGAIKFAQRLSQAIARARVNHAGNELTITASFGIAAASQSQADGVEALRAVASRRCAMAKKLGGNRVVGMVEEGTASGTFTVDDLELPAMTIAEALNLIARGRDREVVPHVRSLQMQLKPLLDLLKKHRPS